MTFLSSNRIPQRIRLQFRTKYSFKLGENNESHFFQATMKYFKKFIKLP